MQTMSTSRFPYQHRGLVVACVKMTLDEVCTVAQSACFRVFLAQSVDL